MRILGETRFAALERREADVAIRLSRPEAGELTATRIGQMTFRLSVHPDHLAATPEAERASMAPDGPMAHAPQQASLARIAAGAAFGFRADQAEIQLALAAAGGGVATLPDFMAAGRSDLVALRPEEPPLLREVQPAAAMLDTRRREIAGRLRVSMPVLFGRLRIAHQHMRVCASPVYPAAAGPPSSLADLASHRAVL